MPNPRAELWQCDFWGQLFLWQPPDSPLSWFGSLILKFNTLYTRPLQGLFVYSSFTIPLSPQNSHYIPNTDFCASSTTVLFNFSLFPTSSMHLYPITKFYPSWRSNSNFPPQRGISSLPLGSESSSLMPLEIRLCWHVLPCATLWRQQDKTELGSRARQTQGWVGLTNRPLWLWAVTKSL